MADERKRVMTGRVHKDRMDKSVVVEVRRRVRDRRYKKIVTRRNIFLRKTHYLVLPGYDPRIHALYFCPQLYKLDSANKLVPLEGEEIGALLARSVRNGVVEKRPWYEPLEQVPKEPVVASIDKTSLDSLVVEDPALSAATSTSDA